MNPVEAQPEAALSSLNNNLLSRIAMRFSGTESSGGSDFESGGSTPDGSDAEESSELSGQRSRHDSGNE